MKKQVLSFALLMLTIVSYAQEEIDKEEVLVEFSFNPKLTNVFKLKTTPKETLKAAKKEVLYQIKSKAVVSDFVPIPKKIRYVSIDPPRLKNYTNYVYGAFGLYNNAEFELLMQNKKSKNYQYGVALLHNNAQNGIEDKRVTNGTWKTHLKIFLNKKRRNLNWKVHADYQYHHIHWYGLNEDIQPQTYQNQNVKQVYHTVAFSGAIDGKNAALKNLTPSIRFFTDAYKNSEIDLNLTTKLNPSLFYNYLNTQIEVQYLNGGFSEGYGSSVPINYSFFNLKLTPSYTYTSNKFKINIGFGVFLNADLETSKTKFFLLPKVQTDVVVLKNIMNLYAGVGSKIYQNSYKRLVLENPFVAPALNIKTTVILADFFAGCRGMLSPKVKYNTVASFKKVANQAMYIHQDQNLNTLGAVVSVAKPFYMGNSFGVVYDDMNIFALKGNIDVDFSDEFTLGAQVAFHQYQPNNQSRAWNMPSGTAQAYVNCQLDKFFAQTSINFIGNRYDLIEEQQVKLNGFLDFNIKTGYKLNKKLNIHANIYNLLNNNYQLYKNYDVQGFQATAGLSYKF